MNEKILWLLATVLLTTVSLAEAQQAGRVPRIGVLLGSSLGPDPRLEAFRQGLRDSGYIEGKNIAVEYRFADGQEDRLPKLAAELVGPLKVEIIVTDGTNVTRAAKNATKTIPIVMASDGDPVGNGFVASLAHPGGNITGLTNLLAGLSGKRLEVLKEAIPGISRMGVIWNPENPTSVTAFKETQDAAQALALQLQSLEVRAPNDFDGAFQAATKRQVSALSVVSDSLMFTNRRRFFRARRQVPASNDAYAEPLGGGWWSYVLWDLLPRLVSPRRHLRRQDPEGTKPADLPVEQPTKFELIINLKTAKQIGLSIPPNLLARADRVIR
jgi:putative ABC transport system substrate-binding protein